MKHTRYNFCRLIFAVFVALLLLCSNSAAWGVIVNLKPGTNWQKDGARFAIYYYKSSDGSQNGWQSMGLVENCTPVYSAFIPSGYDKMIFCRMNGSNTTNDWSNKWNQTGNLDVPSSSQEGYIIPNDTWDGNGLWTSVQLGTCVTGTWLRFAGETITLTATSAGAVHYQWYKDGVAIGSSSLSNTYTKTNCTIADAGTYTCKAWRNNSVLAATSDGFEVKIPCLEYRTPPDGTITKVPFTRSNPSNEYAECTVYPGVAWGYELNVNDGFNRHGNSGTKERSNSTDKWTMETSPEWCRWNTDKEGTYHFYLDFSNSNYTPLQLNIVYPLMSQEGGIPIYMEKTPAMVSEGWTNMYYRIGKGKYDDGDARNYAKAYLMNLVPGTARFYTMTTPNWDHDFWAWHIANNCGSQGDGFSIYQTHSSSEYEITQSINFSGDEIPTGGWTIYEGVASGNGTDWLNDNCIFHGYTTTDGMLTHNVSVGATTHGQIKVEYTHHDNTAHSSEAYTARNFDDLAHTCILTVTGVPDCGYRIASLTVNGVAFTSGNQYILTEDATISATFEIDTYDVTLHTNDGTINSGNVTNYTYLTGATLPTDVTKANSYFDGWYDNAGFTGSPVEEITTTDCGDKEYWAKWGDCPLACSGEAVYKFVTKSSGLGTGNVCAAANTDYNLSTPSPLETLIGGTLTARASSTNKLKYATNAFTFANGEGGVLRVDLNCAIEEGDFIRFINKATGDNYNAYVRHTSSSTSANQLTLASKNPSIATLTIPAAFVGEKTLYIVRGANNGALISYFEIIRPAIVTLDANGGTVDGNATKEMKAAMSESIALPHAVKDGYRFKGWYDAPSGGSPVGDMYTVTGCTTLYAQYEDCPDVGALYKFEVRTDLATENFAETGSFDINKGNYLSELIGGALTGYEGNNNHYISKENGTGIKISNNAGYLKVELDCELEEGDIFKSTVAGNTVYVSKATSRTNTAILPTGTLTETEIPAALVGEKTLYIWRGGGTASIQYFEITRPRRTVITLDAPGATNSYTTSVTAALGSAMPEIAVLPVRAGYVFQGYYDGVGGTGTQYYSATGESVRNWDKDVATATLYAKWQTPCEVEPTLTNVAPVVTIWDQHPVDISLIRLSCPFDTTGILHYTLASVSPTDPIPGCHFEYFDDYIHIMGTPTVYNSSVQTVDVTFTITNDCSPAVTATITQTIQIYPKDQKARIAFIVTGSKDGSFNACTASDMTASNTLVTYLREFYTVDYVNGYATKDPTALATYYDGYDLLVVTDFLDTHEGYTNAIGTLIDKKPILSFEAYVANQSNWHIGSNPKDPHPKVQDMKVLCAGHAIFSDDSYYGTPVDVVNTDTIVHVLDALSTADDAKGLQGFTINEAPDFIFLATIRDANNSRDLIVCCERQVVFPARLMLFGINFYEMGNLSSAGQIIIRQMIDYLLMTDETKIADCSLVFDNGRDNTGYDEAAYHASGGTGTKGDGLWTTAANWAPGYNIIPTPFHPTRIIAECHVNVDNAHAGSVKVNKGRDEHGTPIDGKLIVEPYGGLTVAGIVAKVNDTRYASPTAIKAEDLLIRADATQNGAFVYGNKESDVRATVEYYSRGDAATTAHPVWQYIGIPFQANKTAISMYYAAWMCRWAEGTTDDLGGLWQWVDNEDVLIPFEGYCITQATTKTYTNAGKLNAPVTTVLNLDNRDGDGYAFAANSWTAPIKIQEMQDADFVNAEKAIYIYHTGTYAEWETNGTPVDATSGVATLPGQYAVVPIHSSPYIAGADSVIPAMQGFFVKTTPTEDASLRLVYNRVVYDAKYFKTSTQPMRAPARTDSEPDVMVLMVSGESSGGDRVHLLSRSDFSDSYEDGWDGRKIEGDEAAPKLAVVKQAGEMAVAALPTMEERYLSFRAGKDSLYTMSFHYDGPTIYLYDQLTQQATPIQTGNTYSFEADNRTTINRFLITKNPPQTPTDITVVETDDGLLIENFGQGQVEVRIVDMQGRVLYSLQSTEALLEIVPQLPAGVYLAHIVAGDKKQVVKLIGGEAIR